MSKTDQKSFNTSNYPGGLFLPEDIPTLDEFPETDVSDLMRVHEAMEGRDDQD